jgi:GxxExxY protein
MSITKKYLKDLIYNVNGAAIEIHKALGPGLLESVYHDCMKHELSLRNIQFKSESTVPVQYKTLKLDARLRCDLVVENILAVELKSVEGMIPLYDAQILTYMKLLHVPMGLLINFNSTHIFDHGQRTFVNELYRVLPEA